MSSILLHRCAVITATATFVLLIAGSLVTSTDSGLAVPDWPLSYGTWMPPMVGGIRFEHGHRMIAGVVGLMILALAGWLWRVEPRRWVRTLGYAAAAAVLLQALVGGLTVLLLLPPQMSIAHACIGQAVWCLVACTAHALSTDAAARAPARVPADATRIRHGALAVAMLAAAQLLLGAIIRHTGYAVGWHIANALILVGVSGWLAGRIKRIRDQAPLLWRHAHRLTMLLGVQLLFGLGVWTHRAVIWLRTGHVALGALVLAQAVLLAWDAARQHGPANADAARAADETWCLSEDVIA